MTHSEKLAAILATVQTDPGNRGLARDPDDNLFTATAGDFEAACWSLASEQALVIELHTGFYIPTAEPPTYETDGPLGCLFFMRALDVYSSQIAIVSPPQCTNAIEAGLKIAGFFESVTIREDGGRIQAGTATSESESPTILALEHVGRATDGRYYSMRGRDITRETRPVDSLFLHRKPGSITIGIGDGGNEIGMGKIAHETIVKNIPNGDLIHCRVPTDHLIVAGVSNWGAYALAAGVYVLRGILPQHDLFDPDRERAILEAMVRDGPLVDGVTGKQTATVDGLTWEEYILPFNRIREILES